MSRFKRGKFCPVGFVDVTSFIDGNDVSWEGSQPGGRFAQALNRGVSGGLDAISQRVEQLHGYSSDEADEVGGWYSSVEEMEARYVHAGPGLMGDDYRLHLCVKFRGK